MRDPHYRKILDGLEGPLDPSLFEDCVVDLLRESYPGLVPVRGGQDAGMDGAIGDGAGAPFPLVVTTAKNVIGNLTRSLDSHSASGSPRRRIVLATSRVLTPVKRRNLQRRATEKGYLLVQIHDRHDLASRLYRNSRWAHDLLGLTGTPSALSAIPLRSLREDLPLIGRDADLAWLRDSAEDRLLVGQPGSGKTHLLLQLVREGTGLFLASDDESAIASDCRDLDPKTVLVDDAHLDPGRLDRLRRLRSEIGARFAIIATTWPGYEDDVAAAMGQLSEEKIRRLELLTRRQIVEVLRAIGIEEPEDDPYLWMLVDQSSNRPGLAVLLGSLWLQGEWRAVISGEGLRRSLLPALRRVLEFDPIQLLACFALGGDSGMNMGSVAKFLQLGRDEIRRRVVGASHGGVLKVFPDSARLAVQPAVLRSALLNDVFFTPPAHDFGDLLPEVESKGDAVETLLRAARVGAPIPRQDLRVLVAEAGSTTSWQGLATFGEADGKWVLDRYPGELREIAAAVLISAPRAAIRRLLQESGSAEGPLHSNPGHPLRILQDWVQEIPFVPGHGDQTDLASSLIRRRLLVEEVGGFIGSGGDRAVAIRAGCLALSPRLESHRETVTGEAVTIRQGLLPASFVPEILELWGSLHPEIGELDEETWAVLEEVLHQWSYPHVLGADLEQEETAALRVVSQQMIRDLEARAERRPGLWSSLRRWADVVHLPLDRAGDEDFNTLYPSEYHLPPESWQQEEEKQRTAARDLARDWSTAIPVESARRLAGYEREAQVFGHRESVAFHSFGETLAKEVAAPESWVGALIEHRVSANLVSPFLHRIVSQQRPGWFDCLRDVLHIEKYGTLGAMEALRVEGLDSELLAVAIEKIHPHLIEGACRWGDVPLGTLKFLLRHPRAEIALAAATGEWACDPKGEVHSEIEQDWRTVVLDAGAGGGIERLRRSNHHLKEILRSAPDVASDWLRARLRDAGDYEVVAVDGVYAAAVRALGEDQRASILNELPETYFGGRLALLLVGRSPRLYRRLLGLRHLADHQLEPLAGGPPGGDWPELAELALEAGYEPMHVAAAAFYPPMTISGSGVEHWNRWREAFARLLQSSEGRLHSVAEQGLAIAAKYIDEAKEREHQFELTGRF